VVATRIGYGEEEEERVTLSENGSLNVEAIVDGACDPNPGRGGWGAVLTCGKYKKRLWGPQKHPDSFRHQTNNRMELIAAIEALSALKKPCSVRIYSDSAYLINTMNQVYTKGRNLDLWHQLESAAQDHSVEWIKATRAQTREAHLLANKGIRLIQDIDIRELS
jgi:ribonuclease HI